MVGKITDHQLTSYYDDVILFDDIVNENTDLTYNEVQLQVFANAEKFVAMSGGTTLLLNLFKAIILKLNYAKHYCQLFL